MCSKDYLNCGGRCPADIHTHCQFQGSLGSSGQQKALREQALDSGRLEALSLEALSRCRRGGGEQWEEEGVRQGISSSQPLGRKLGLSPWISLSQCGNISYKQDIVSSPYWRQIWAAWEGRLVMRKEVSET